MTRTLAEQRIIDQMAQMARTVSAPRLPSAETRAPDAYVPRGDRPTEGGA